MAKFFRFFIILLLSNIILLSCSFQPRELSVAEQLIETAPDSALHILQGLNPTKYRFDNNRALYGLLMIRALDKKMLPLKPDSLLDFSIDYYMNHPDNDLLASCYFYKGRMCKYAFQYESAIIFYLKALDIVNYNNSKLLNAKINFDLGDIFLAQRDFSKAREKYRVAYNYFSSENQKIFAFYCLNNIGKTYTQQKLYNKAYPYYYSVYKVAKDSLVKGLAIQNIGLYYYYIKQYDSALKFMREDLKYPGIKNNKSIRYYYISDIFFDLNQNDSAIYYAQNALKNNPDIRTKRECYRILANVGGLKKDLNAVSNNMSKYQDCSDSIRKIDAQTKGSYIETVHNSTKEVVKANHKMSYLYFLLALIIILSVTAFFMIRKRNKKEKQDTEQLHLQQKATMHKGTIVNHREVLQNKIKERKAMLASERKKASPTGKIEIDRKVYEELLHINDTEYFYDEMNSVLNNLVNKLNKLYPTLTPREVKWCCLSLLQIPSTDMYLLLDTNVDSLKKMKQRLAPKFNLMLVSELEDFLFNLISE